jgi:hypothetical protein
MRKIGLFVEDRGHAVFLEALVQRLANQYRIPVVTRLGSATGGYGKMVSKLKEYINELQSDQEELPDLLIVATDGNCKGFTGRKQEIDSATKSFHGRMIYAIPDPHIERWLLLDSVAFKKVLGKGCSAPIQKCERYLYKRLLLEAVRNTGVNPPLGGIEYTEDLVHAMNLEYLERTEDSLGKLLKALREVFKEWKLSDQFPSDQIREI